jgi:hypothetical protein
LRHCGRRDHGLSNGVRKRTGTRSSAG